MPLFRIVSGDTLVLPPLPKWPLGHADFQMLYATLEALRRHSPQINVSAAKDARFIKVPASILPAAIAWTLALQRQLGGFRPESRDCDDFADVFDLAISWMAARACLDAAPLVGSISVECRYSYAGIPAVGAHALNVVDTNLGLFVVEPQNGTHCPLESYPNRAFMFAADGF